MSYSVDKIKLRLRELGVSDQTFIGKEIKVLLKALKSNEELLGATKGFYEDAAGLLCLTQTRIFFISIRMLSSNIQEFSLASISSISYRSGFLFGEIKIFLSGNNVTITKAPKFDAKRFVDSVSELLSKNNTSPPKGCVDSNTKSEADIYDKLEKLGNLKAKGYLTEDEFLEEKSRILDKPVADCKRDEISSGKSQEALTRISGLGKDEELLKGTEYSQGVFEDYESRSMKRNRIFVPHNVTHESNKTYQEVPLYNNRRGVKISAAILSVFLLYWIFIPDEDTSSAGITHNEKELRSEDEIFPNRTAGKFSRSVEKNYVPINNSDDCKMDAVAISVQVHNNLLSNRELFAGVDLEAYKRKGCNEDFVKEAIRATLN